MKPLLRLLPLLASPLLMAAEPVSPDAEARYLAGLPVEGTPLEALTKEKAWQEHSADFKKAWDTVDKRQFSKIAEWMPKVAPETYSDESPLLYFYSGPDILYAHAFFPNASTTIMCGIEPVGSLPDVAALTPEHRAESLRNLRKSLEAVLSFSFFRTAAMKTDLQNTALNGTLPVMYLFLAHSNCKLTKAEKVWLDANGEEHAEKSDIPGAKIEFTGPSGKTQTVYYFSSDLSNGGIKKNAGFTTFCAKQGKANGFLKAASFLMHESDFSASKDFLLAHTKLILQDDSGIPFHFYKAAGWSFTLAGHYKGPIDLFKNCYQADLNEAYKVKDPAPVALPFSFGYRWHSDESVLFFAKAPAGGAGAVTPPTTDSATPAKAVPVKE